MPDIYVVDDSYFNLEIINRRLTSAMPCSVLLFEDAWGCMESMKEHEPDLVLTDFHLNRSLEGQQWLETLNREHATVPVIVYSSAKDVHVSGSREGNSPLVFVHRDVYFLDNLVTEVKRKLNHDQNRLVMVVEQ